MALVVVNLRCVAYDFHRTYFAYKLASSDTHSGTPTAEELQYLIDHLRAQAHLNENYAREVRCLGAVLEGTRAYHDVPSLPLPPANISPVTLFAQLPQRAAYQPRLPTCSLPCTNVAYNLRTI